MALLLIGLGLDPRDLSKRAIDAISTCDAVLLETYTSRTPMSLEDLTTLVRSDITPITRAMLENDDVVFARSKSERVALLVFGDPLAATTHTELVLRSRAAGIEVEVFSAPSVFSGVAQAGLELYRYGITASLVYPRKNWLPERAKQIIAQNRSIKAHSLVLLDIVTGVDEFSLLDTDHEAFASLDRSIIEHETTSLAGEPQLLMSPNEAIAILKHQGAIEDSDTLIVCSRLGSDSARIVSGPAHELVSMRFGLGPHALVIPSQLHFLEEEFIGSLR